MRIRMIGENTYGEEKEKGWKEAQAKKRRRERRKTTQERKEIAKRAEGASAKPLNGGE